MTKNGYEGDTTIGKSAVAKELERMHFEAEEGLQRVIRITGSEEAELSPGEPIKLLEVNAKHVTECSFCRWRARNSVRPG